MYVYGQASHDAYAIHFSPWAEEAFRGTPPEVGAEIRKRLQELALVAGPLSSTFADRVSSTLRLEIQGYIVTYVLSDANRTLTVMSVSRFTSQGAAANQ
jgi:hypothetical protein